MQELFHRVAAMINRCVVSGIDNRTKNPLWVVKGVVDQDKEVEVFEPYGMTSSPPEGAEALRFALEADESHCVTLGATGGSYRPRDGLPGEVIHYSKWEGDTKHRIHFREDKQAIDILSGENAITLNNEQVTATIAGNQITLDATALTITIGANTFKMDASGFSGTQDATFDGVSVSGHKHFHGTPETSEPI